MRLLLLIVVHEIKFKALLLKDGFKSENKGFFPVYKIFKHFMFFSIVLLHNIMQSCSIDEPTFDFFVSDLGGKGHCK